MAARIPSYRYHKASNQAVVVLDGKSHYLGTWNSPASRVEYDRLIGEWVAERRRRTLRAEQAKRAFSDVTINELLLAFLEYAETHYRTPDGTPTRHTLNLRDALKPVRALYGSTLARDFGPLALRAVRE